MGHTLFTLSIGIFFILLGLSVYKFPILISGYNTLPKKERQKIDIRPIARIIRNCLCTMGVISIGLPFLFDALGVPAWNSYLLPVVIFGGVIVILVLVNLQPAARRIKQSGKTKKNALSITAIVLLIAGIVPVALFGVIYRTAQPAVITVEDNRLNIQGAYGLAIPLEEITQVEVTDNPPRMDYRQNGISFSRYHKGYYYAKGQGAFRLFLHSGKPPYLLLTTKKNGKILINRQTPQEIEQLRKAIEFPVESKLSNPATPPF